MAAEEFPPLGAHAYVYAGVPPPAVTVAVPLFPPLHDVAVEVSEEVSAVGSVIGTVTTVTHPAPSVTVTLQEPADNPVAEEVVCPLHHE